MTYTFSQFPNLFGLQQVAVDPPAANSVFKTRVEANWAAMATHAQQDVLLAYWGGEDAGVIRAGVVVAVTPNTSPGHPNSMHVAEAYDHDLASPQWRRRPVGILVTDHPRFGQYVRVRLLGRALVDKALWSSTGPAGAFVLLKEGRLGEIGSYGQMTLNPAETALVGGSSIPVGLNSFGPSIIVRPRLIAT